MDDGLALIAMRRKTIVHCAPERFSLSEDLSRDEMLGLDQCLVMARPGARFSKCIEEYFVSRDPRKIGA